MVMRGDPNLPSRYRNSKQEYFVEQALDLPIYYAKRLDRFQVNLSLRYQRWLRSPVSKISVSTKRENCHAISSINVHVS